MFKSINEVSAKSNFFYMICRYLRKNIEADFFGAHCPFLKKTAEKIMLFHKPSYKYVRTVAKVFYEDYILQVLFLFSCLPLSLQTSLRPEYTKPNL
jgi:hypothetical protein